jgi:hypothetical protein
MSCNAGEAKGGDLALLIEAAELLNAEDNRAKQQAAMWQRHQHLLFQSSHFFQPEVRENPEKRGLGNILKMILDRTSSRLKYSPHYFGVSYDHEILLQSSPRIEEGNLNRSSSNLLSPCLSSPEREIKKVHCDMTSGSTSSIPSPASLGESKKIISRKRRASLAAPTMMDSSKRKMNVEEKIQFVRAADFSADSIMPGSQSATAVGNGNNTALKQGKLIFDQDCLVCDKRYTNRLYYYQHCRDVHNLCMAANEFQLSCSLCGVMFSSLDKYKEHEEKTKTNLIYCIKKMEALRMTKGNTNRLYKSVTAIDLQLIEENKKYQ